MQPLYVIQNQPTTVDSPRANDASPERIALGVFGMTCAGCQSHVQRALVGQAGVHDAMVNLMTHQATVVYYGAVVTPADLVRGGAVGLQGFIAFVGAVGNLER